MITSAAGRKAIMEREGVKLAAYKDSVGVLTIGVGHTTAAGPPEVKGGMRITKAQAEDILRRDLAKVEAQIMGIVAVDMSQGQFDALVSLVFNIGGGAFRKSAVARKLNAGDYQGAANAFLQWRNAGGKPILLKRRQAERAQFLDGTHSGLGLVSQADPVETITGPPAPDEEAPDPVASASSTSELKDYLKDQAKDITAKQLSPDSTIVAVGRRAVKGALGAGAVGAVTTVTAAAPEAHRGWWQAFLDAISTPPPLFYFLAIGALVASIGGLGWYVARLRVQLEKTGRVLPPSPK